MRVLIVIFMWIFFNSFVSGGVLNDLYRLDIVHYNDFHARFEETSVSYPLCTSNDNDCLGGFARLYYEIQLLLKEKPGALLLNAGDTFQGSYWYTLLKWNVTQEFINMLPNDAHAIGNHEFDDDIAGLAPYLAAIKGPVLAANMDTSQEPSLNGLYKPHVVMERKGRKIGIIGLITPDTKQSSKTSNVIFLDPIQVVNKEAQLLTEQGVDIIIVLSHCGLEVDKKIAETVGENIDVIVGGHSHSLLWNGESPSHETISGPYPVLVETQDKPGHKVLVVTASAFSKYLGNVTLYFDKKGELQSFDGEPIFLNRSIPEDPEILKVMQPYKDRLKEVVQEKIGYTSDDLNDNSCGSQECAIGDIIADAYRNATEELGLSNLPNIVFYPRNMIRGSIAKGEITKGAIINIMPFTNKVMTFSIRGKYVMEALQKSMTSYWVQKPFSGPWMPQVSGLKLQINLTDLNDVKITAFVTEDEMKPLDMEKEYQVTSLDFLVRGGNGLTMLKDNAQNVTLVGKDTDVFEAYVRKLSPISAILDNRLTVIN